MDIHFNRLTAKYKKEKVKKQHASLLNFYRKRFRKRLWNLQMNLYRPLNG